MQRMDKILAAANDLQKRGLIKDPKASAALSKVSVFKHIPSQWNLTRNLQVNKRGLLASMTESPSDMLSSMLETLDLPTPQPIGLAAVPDKVSLRSLIFIV